MLILPIQTPNHVADMLIIILDDDGLARMSQADPAQIKLSETRKTLVNPTVLICHEKDSPELTGALNSGDLSKIGKFLSRGFAFRPDKGDHDDGPKPLFSGRN